METTAAFRGKRSSFGESFPLVVEGCSSLARADGACLGCCPWLVKQGLGLLRGRFSGAPVEAAEMPQWCCPCRVGNSAAARHPRYARGLLAWLWRWSVSFGWQRQSTGPVCTFGSHLPAAALRRFPPPPVIVFLTESRTY